MATTRRILSLLFLFLMALNAIGYYGFLVIIKSQLTQRTQARLESHAQEIGGNMIIKLPVSFPYSADSPEYGLAEGEITYEGTVYHRIKQRLYHDTLYVVCLRDSHATQAQDQIEQYSRSFAGQGGETEPAGIKIMTTLAKYYFPCIPSPRCMPGGAGFSILAGSLCITAILPARSYFTLPKWPHKLSPIPPPGTGGVSLLIA
jgi:hypothetical protein